MVQRGCFPAAETWFNLSARPKLVEVDAMLLLQHVEHLGSRETSGMLIASSIVSAQGERDCDAKAMKELDHY